ncbi:MAG: alpha/beta hydrolase [Bacteroidota bacterium]|nr:alpha/beta hydrolase [Bacteroidota bacterium]
MKKLFLLLFGMMCLSANAQYSVRLVVTDVATKKNDDIYVAGTFNNWNPKDELYKLKPFGGSRKGIVIKDIAPGNYAFKFTRGSMDKVECMADGRDISDRVLDINADLVMEYTIAGWKDDYPEKPKQYTASPQVKIMDTAFAMPQLNRKRRIWLYLPKNYTLSSKTYPVVYMHDGQNLFNDQTSFSGEWGVDECLDSIQKLTGRECIVVGIDNGGEKRMSEYNPYDNDKFGKGGGKQYVDFIVNTLKPYIDAHYRTKKGPAYTYIAGSSMGGLISLYAVMQYPSVFGAAGVFSPAFWVAPALYEQAKKFITTSNYRLYFYAGKKESETIVGDMQKMEELLKHNPNYEIKEVINPLGQHNEKYWRQELFTFFLWLLK